METNNEYKLLISKVSSGIEEENVIVCDIIIPEDHRDEFTRLLGNNDSSIKNAVLLFTMENSGISRKVNFVLNTDYSGDRLDAAVSKIEKEEPDNNDNISNASFSLPYVSVDEKFRKQILALIEENISNPDFDVDDIVSQIGMSRAQLYRKLESLSGETVKEFVRNIRLRSAAKLLNNNNIRVSEVMGMVGFTNRAYFIKCFKQQFGICPSDYKKQYAA